MYLVKGAINESYEKGVSDKKQETILGIVGLSCISGIGGLTYYGKRKISLKNK